MTERTQIALAAKDRILQAARKELAKFEDRERAFRQSDRVERARDLHLPLRREDLH